MTKRALTISCLPFFEKEIFLGYHFLTCRLLATYPLSCLFCRVVKYDDEVHQAFLIHCWSHDNKLGETNRLTAYPLSCLFSHFVKYDEQRENEAGSAFTSVKKTAMAWNKKSFNADLHSLLKQDYVKCLLNFFFHSSGF